MQEAGAGRPAHLVAAVLVEHDQENRHGDDDADHDEGVEHGVEERWPTEVSSEKGASKSSAEPLHPRAASHPPNPGRCRQVPQPQHRLGCLV